MSVFIWNLLSFLVALGILVTVHEFGHFWVARRCGVKVETFSIGFGKSIWSRKGQDGTQYTVAMIPLGGYVKMLDSRVEEIAETDKQFAFDHKPLWKRTAIVAAGPIFNFLFAIFAYWLVFLIGVPAVKPVIGEVTPHSIVAQAGIEPGMELNTISGIKTPDWESVNMGLISHIGDDELPLSVTVADELGAPREIVLDISSWSFNPETESAMQSLGFLPYRPAVTTTLAMVSEGGAGERSGLQVGDTLLELNEKPVTQWQQVVETIRDNAEQAISVTVLREGERLSLTLRPDSRKVADDQQIGFAGVAPQTEAWPEEYRFDMQYGPIAAVGKAVEKTGQVIDLTLSMLKKLLVGDVGLNNLSGPISIAKGAGTTADYGLVYFLGFLALISVNLGIINLVPLPMLDGGHLLFFAIEAVIRRPVPEKVQEMGYRIGGMIIFSLMALALFNDFSRL
ncbi:sigma E protease regulator RseP [Vibrio sp. SM6]|uniref:Zinc metalloprotease n=1 Tax=Vibrio agarilyticus TaxID=2726741 RepID=A0A7X8TQS4_9VIBR|nr:sigma E protease regulator RseP [Vibrio agarilyticus]NLS13160.1 sigma E protease regulator RseP [Vibrio agarilyticus]